MNSIIAQAQQYVQQHPFELVTSVVTASAFGLYLTWWKTAEDRDLAEDEAEDEAEEEAAKTKAAQSISAETTKAPKVQRPPP